MTGLECLREELKKRGFNDHNVNGKLVAAVLDILSNTDHVYSDMVKAEQELDAVRKDVKRKSLEYRKREFYLEQAERDFKQARLEVEQYIEKFNAALSECETAEGRDAMRRAQTFVNSVSVNSKYDNTAYIIGLASILTNGGIGAIDKLKKLNPKLFREDELSIEL